MADPIAPITDDYIDSVILSNGPFDPNLNKTQGIPTRQLLKSLRDYLLQEIGDVPAGLTDILYADLVTALAAGTLIPGAFYRITDFQTTHYIYNASPATLHSGPIEPLVVLALSSTAIAADAWSQTYPQDMITYTTSNSYTSGASKGCILSRHDTIQNVFVNNDFRNIVYRRHGIVANTFNQANAYPFCATTMGPDGAWYYLSNPNGFAAGTATTPTNTDDNWVQFYPDNTHCYSFQGSGIFGPLITSNQSPSYTNPRVTVDTTNYIDSPIFQNYGAGYFNVDIRCAPGQLIDLVFLNDGQAVIARDVYINFPVVDNTSRIVSSTIVLKGTGYMEAVRMMDGIEYSTINTSGAIRNWTTNYLVYSATVNVTTLTDAVFTPYYGVIRGNISSVFGFRMEFVVTPIQFNNISFPAGMGNLKFTTNANAAGWSCSGLGLARAGSTFQSSAPDVIVNTAMSWRTFVGYPDFTTAASHTPSTDLNTQIQMAKTRHIVYAYEQPSYKSVFDIANGSALVVNWQTDLAPVNLSTPSGADNSEKRLMTYFTRHGNDFQVQQKDLISGSWLINTSPTYTIDAVDSNGNVTSVTFTPKTGSTESIFIIV